MGVKIIMTEKLANTIENSVEKKSYKKYIWAGILGASALIGVWLMNRDSSDNSENQADNQPQKCAQSWEMPGLPHPDGNYIDKGVEKFTKVDNKIDPKKPLKDDWLSQIITDRVLLERVGEKFSEYGDNKKIDIDPNSLVDSQGCATEVAKSTVNNIEKNIDESRVNYAKTPRYFANSFFDSKTETIQYSKVPAGNESARITFKTTRILDILGICGNIAEPRQKPVITTESNDKDKESNKDHKDKKEKNKPKSGSSIDYKQPGDGPESDSGAGTKPKVGV
jgi:hypothetical protein